MWKSGCKECFQSIFNIQELDTGGGGDSGRNGNGPILPVNIGRFVSQQLIFIFFVYFVVIIFFYFSM